MSDNSAGGSWVPGSTWPPGQTLTAPALASPVVSGTATGAGTLTYTNAPTANISGLVNYVKSAVTLTPASTITATSGVNAIRGEMNLPSGKTLSGTSFATGTYGRANIFGTVDIGSGALAGLYGKMDLNGSTLTSGHIAPVQSNIVNPPATANDAGVSLFYGESASGTPIGNGIELYMAADYFLKLTQVSGGSFFTPDAPTTLAKGLKINVGGTDYWIGLYSAAS